MSKHKSWNLLIFFACGAAFLYYYIAAFGELGSYPTVAKQGYKLLLVILAMETINNLILFLTPRKSGKNDR